jgi:hypothetical protein
VIGRWRNQHAETPRTAGLGKRFLKIRFRSRERVITAVGE